MNIRDIKNRFKEGLKNKVKESIYKYVLPIVFDEEMKLWRGETEFKTLQSDGTWQIATFKNQVLLGGLQIIAELLYELPFKVPIHTFEHDLYTTAEVDERPHITIDPSVTKRKVYGYNVAADGAEGADILPYSRYKNGYDFNNLIPWRVIPETENDYAVMRSKYLHHRIILINGVRFVAYYTKKPTITYRAKYEDDTDVGPYPNETATVDQDCRLVAEFSVEADEDELVEFFRLTRAGGAKSTTFSAILVMAGYPASWEDTTGTATIPGQSYDSMMDSYVFARCNHPSVPHGVDGTNLVKYRIMHI